MAGTTRADDIAAALRAEILAGRVRPGGQLKFQTLTARYNASIGVMREVLSRLVDAGLAEVSAHQGYRVKRLSYDELRDVTEARLQIEVYVLEDSIRHATLEWEGQVVAAHHVLEQTQLHDPDDPTRMSDAWAVAHERFHSALLANSSNTRMRAFATRLREETELYRRWSVSLPIDHHRDIRGEHRALLDHATAREPELAGAVLREHISRTTEIVLASTSEPHAKPTP